MKNILLTITAVVTLALCGCATLDKTAYKTLEGSRIIVQNATMAFGDYCRAMEARGTPVPQANIDRAREVFNKWKSASLKAGKSLHDYIQAKNSGGAIEVVEVALNSALAALDFAQSEYLTVTQKSP